MLLKILIRGILTLEKTEKLKFIFEFQERKMEVESLKEKGENEYPFVAFLSNLSVSFPSQDSLAETIGVFLNNQFTVREAAKLGEFVNHLWKSNKWSEQDVEKFQLEIAFAEGMEPLLQIFKTHPVYKYLFEQNPRPAQEYPKVYYLNDNNIKASPKFNNEKERFSFIDYHDKFGEEMSKYKKISCRLDSDLEFLFKDIDEIKSIKIIEDGDKLPEIVKTKLIFFWYTKKYCLSVKGNKICFEPGMFPLSYFPSIFTLEVNIYSEDGLIECFDDKENNYNLIIKGIKHHPLNEMLYKKKHHDRYSDPTDFGFMPSYDF